MKDIRNIETDLDFENKIRPQQLEAFSGQDKIVDNLHVFIQAALMRGEALDHVLLHGPQGTGQDDAREHHQQRDGGFAEDDLGPGARQAGRSGRSADEPRQRRRAVHRRDSPAQPIVEEYLYSAMEDYKIDIVLDKGPSARSIQIELNPFTLIGATTRSGLLTSRSGPVSAYSVIWSYYDSPAY